jgi:hypothetical protein
MKTLIQGGKGFRSTRIFDKYSVPKRSFCFSKHYDLSIYIQFSRSKYIAHWLFNTLLSTHNCFFN